MTFGNDVRTYTFAKITDWRAPFDLALKLMSRLIFAGLFISAVTSVVATDFAARVSSAKSVGQSQEGKKLLLSLGGAYNAAMRACISPSATVRDKAEKFELVADVSADGHMHGVTVRPETPMSRCFANHISSQAIKPPPKLGTSTSYPIYIEIEIAQ